MNNQRDSFELFCKERLNKEQQEIVARENGLMIIHAGAGSGKTRVITARVTSLMLNYLNPSYSLLALTFTNKAAREMKERIIHFLGDQTPLPFIGTFHSYCVRLLRSNRDLFEMPDFTIMDDDDQEKLIKTIILKLNINKKMTPRAILSAVSRLKNSAVTGSLDFEQIEDPLLRDIAYRYEKEKNASRCLDFDDLLLSTLRLFKKEAAFKESHQKRVRHILVDEYQDTNHVQHALLKEMLLDKNDQFSLESLCVVGDEDQSIYSWRGAVAGTMVTFKKTFPQAESLTLEQNYRSVQPILDIANDLIQHNTLRKPKKLWSHKQGSDRVRVLTCVSGYQEGEVVAEFCKHYKVRTSSLKQCAILYRSHYQSRALEEALVRHSIPYKILGGTQFYDRLEIKDLLAYMRLVVNPFDRMSWLRAINTPSRGLGDKFQEQFIEFWDQQPFLNFKEISLQMLKDGSITGSKRDSLLSFLAIFSEKLSTLTAYQALEHIIERSAYMAYLKNSFEPEEAEERKDNVKELLHATASREEQGVTAISQFLEEVALLQEHTHRDNEGDYVKLMTLHSAKGLEFDSVILTGLEEGVLPSNHSLMSPESIEEERRLLYVGITRAQERLLITNTKYRYTYGQMTDQRASRFIKEITASHHIGNHDATQWAQPQIVSYCKQWCSSITREDDSGSSNETILEKKDINLKAWHLKQAVRHKLFGKGTIENIETKGNGSIHLTIRFAEGIKKIASQFVKLQ